MPDARSSEVEVLVFFGAPGTLKTFLSARVAARLGYVYLPTSAAGRVSPGMTAQDRTSVRVARYARVAQMLTLLLEQGVRGVVLDGGFPTEEARRAVRDAAKEAAAHVMLVRCISSDTSKQRQRLARRAADEFDHEAGSAKDILVSGGDVVELPSTAAYEAASMGVDTATGRMDTSRAGERGSQLAPLIGELMGEHAALAEAEEAEHRARVTSSFAQLASTYDSTTEWRAAKKLLGQLEVDLPPSSAVLDIGCGTGLAGAVFELQGFFVLGVDLVPAMLKRARARASSVLTGDVQSLPLKSDAFDLAILRQVLHYTFPGRTLGEAARVLKPGGRLVVQSTVSRSDAAAQLWRSATAHTQPERRQVFTTTSLSSSLELAGLQIVRVESAVIERRDSFTAMSARAAPPAEGWHAWWRHLAELAANRDPELQLVVDEGGIVYQQAWATVHARKAPPTC